MIMVAVLSVNSRDFHWRLLRAEERVKTITDPLRGSTLCVHCYHQARTLVWCFASFGISDAYTSFNFSFPHGFSTEPL